MSRQDRPQSVKVKWALGGNNSSFWLDDWQLTVEEWRVS